MSRYISGRPLPFVRRAEIAASRLEPRWRASWRQLSEMDGIGPVEPDQLVRWNRAAIRQEFTGVLEDDDTVAEQAPALFGVGGHDARGRPVPR